MSSAIRKVEYKLYPKPQQQALLMDALIHHQQLYNWALKERIDTYKRFGYSLTYADQCKINTIYRERREAAKLPNFNAQSEQQTLKRLDLAFKAFFRRLNNGEKPGFPRFKSVARYSGWGYKSHGDGYRLYFKSKKNGSVRLSGVGIIKMRGQARNEGGTPRTAEILRRCDGWYISVSYAYDKIERQGGTKAKGFDWGVETYVTLIDDDGNIETYDNPRFLRSNLDKLAGLQRDLSLLKKRSPHRAKLKQRIAKLHRQIANQRKNYAHQVTADIVKNSAAVACEKLTPKNMSRSAKGTLEKPGKRVKQKSGLNREILSAAPGLTMNLLRCKAEEAGNLVVEVPTKQVKPSQTCPACHAKKKKSLSQRVHDCPCGLVMPRDAASAWVNLNWMNSELAGNRPGARIPEKHHLNAV